MRRLSGSPTQHLQGRSRTFHANRAAPGYAPVISTGPQDAKWHDLPSPVGRDPFHLDLKYVLDPGEMRRIDTANKLVFHTVGDTGGVNTNMPQERVARYMELDFDPVNPASQPAFFYHLGDVVYYCGEDQNYFAEFYEPYIHYPAPIFAIPGNHDGEINPDFSKPSLYAWVRNFCAQTPQHLREANDAPRDAMTQPNVFWTLDTPLATIVGLYTNVPEGGQLGVNQIAWLENELKNAPKDRALILALHHPIYSAYGPHPGSQHLLDKLGEACEVANRVPDLVLTAHVHNYQRFTAPLLDRPETQFVVAGAGGYNQRLHALSREFHNLSDGTRPIRLPQNGIILQSYCDHLHGYLKVEVTKSQIQGFYYAVPDSPPNPLAALTPWDQFTIPLGLTSAAPVSAPPGSH